jgi:hypothetical protein
VITGQIETKGDHDNKKKWDELGMKIGIESPP